MIGWLDFVRMSNKENFITDLVALMPLEQKAGQCLVIGFVGTVIMPQILRRIRDYAPAGQPGVPHGSSPESFTRVAEVLYGRTS